MTEKPKAETNLDGERFEAVSAVVGQMAHDFNNLLTPLLAYPTLIKSDLPDGAYGASLLAVIEKTARDMVHVTKQLLELTTRRPFERIPLDINTVVERVLKEIKSAGPLPEGLVIETNLAGDLAPIEAFGDRLATALHNICMNGIEAIGAGGKLTIETRTAHEEGRATSCGHPLQAGDYVRVRIADTGPGIPPEVRDRIFDPFVTTKKSGARRGAGLGLSVAYRISRDHAAFIDVDSAPGKGSVFTLYFPVAGGNANHEGEDAAGEPLVDPPVVSAAPKDGGSIESNKERILLVDDERTILKLFQMILSSAFPDRKIDLAANGKEAVDLFLKEHQGVLVMDLHMPVMDGQAAFCEIEKTCRARNWEMPAVIFCTGFAPPDTVRNVVSSNPMHGLLSKPIGGDVLVEMVRSRLAP